jgi:SAM-dependent methyltransferase
LEFSEEWEERYRENTNMSIWPWSDLVSYVNNYVKPLNSQLRVLELGCGAGANIPFFQSFNADYFGIDGSNIIINMLKKKFPDIKDNLKVGDITNEIMFKGEFDLIIDRSALTHNSTKGIKKGLDFAYEKLKNNGKFIGVGWFSTKCSEFTKGQINGDKFTKSFQNGPFANIGTTHFAEKFHMIDFFKKFKILVLDHKIIKKEIPENEHTLVATWDIVAQKNNN